MPLSRRSLLQIVGLTAGGLTLGPVIQEQPVWAKPMSPELQQELKVCDPPGDPLQALLQRNRDFSKVWQEMARESSPEARMRLQARMFRSGCQIDPSALDQGQRPWVGLLSCADARVAPEFVFASGSGELFQVRCAGNTAFDEAIASLEYAVSVLKVRLIMVLGHSGCGAVKAARNSEPLTPLLQKLVTPIRASLVSGDSLTQAIEGNARDAARQLTARSAVLRDAQAAGTLAIHSAFFDIGSGLVRVL